MTLRIPEEFSNRLTDWSSFVMMVYHRLLILKAESDG
jgi:hypothetical protein